MFENRTVLGFVEEIELVSIGRKVKARIDTGATLSSIDEKLADELDAKRAGYKIVKSSHGTTKRELIEATIKVNGREVSGRFSVFDRSHMTYPILIGQNILKQGFIIDPKKK